MLQASSSNDGTATPRGEAFAVHVLAIVESIPPGRVMTYGDVAAVLGSRAARTVGQILSHSGGSLPWWRVVRHGGHPPTGLDQRARAHYNAEGTPLVDATTDAGFRVDFAAARWSPDRS